MEEPRQKNRPLSRLFKISALGLAGVLVAGAGYLSVQFAGAKSGRKTGTQQSLPVKIKATEFARLPGWKNDRHSEVLQAFAKSCAIILREPEGRQFDGKNIGGKNKDWRPACEDLENVPPDNDARAREYFEKWFRPYEVSAPSGARKEGLFTGYYVQPLHGSREKSERYRYPVLKTPDGLEEGRWTRRDIMEGKGPGAEDSGNILFWVDNLVDLVFAQIQGSGLVFMDDGTQHRIEYGAGNGHGWTGIGGTLLREGLLERGKATMQDTRAALEKLLRDDPERALELIYRDRSYIFFREVGLDEGPIGTKGVVLTPERSLAVDSRLPYGMPVWIDASPPAPGDERLQRLMVAQDTGGAIKIKPGEAVRGDFFWGSREDKAGGMGSRGHYWFLLPKHLKP